MSLSLERRMCGNALVIGCFGMIVMGDSSTKLENEVRGALERTNKIVLDLRCVDRIDSSGLGLMVRLLSRVRDKGGDLRLASPTSFVRKLLAATKLDSVFLVYTSDYNAVASFFLRNAPGERTEFIGTVLFLDPSEDLCAFARSVLGQYGYEVLTASSFADAHAVAQGAQPAIILIGAQAARENDSVVPALKMAAPIAVTMTLPADFGQGDPRPAAQTLLNAVKQAKEAHA